MSNWSYRGTNLDDLGIVTLVSDAFKMPERRGANVMIPYRHGRVWVEKYFEQRSLELGIEIHESDAEALEAKIDQLKALMGLPGLGTLAQTLENLSQRTCQAEFTGDLHITRTSPLAVKMVLGFTIPEPFFRSTLLASDEQTVNSTPLAYTLNNPGSAQERDPIITLTGRLNNTVIANSTNGLSLTYSGSIPSPRVVTISTDDNGEYIATNDLGANVIGNISHSGDVCLFALEPGDNDLSVTDGLHTTGKIKVEFYPPYL